MIYTVTLNPALDKTVEISRFAVDTVNRVTALRTDPGGKGINVSKVIARLGGASVAVGLLGGRTGRAVADSLQRQGLDCLFLYAEGETRTNLKIVDPVGHTNTDINEPGLRVDQSILDRLLGELSARLRPADLVVLAGSLPPGAPADTYRVWAARCQNAGARVFLDADGAPLAAGLAAAPYLVKPNIDELSRLVGHALDEAGALAAARRLLADGVEKVVVSMGSRGMLYVTRGAVLRAEGLKVPVGSTVGAGDSVVAALAVAEEQGMTPEQTVRLSTATGAANVMSSGTQAADYAVIRELMPRVAFHKM